MVRTESDIDRFCMSPFSRMTCDPIGKYRTCCYHPPLKKDYDNVVDAFYGEEMNVLRKRMMSDEHIDECEQCYQYDLMGELSQRVVMNLEHKFKKNFHIEGLEIAFDNKCNHACVTCKPESSTMWANRVNFNLKKKNINYDCVDFSKLKHLSLTGGEPTIQSQFSPDFFKKLDIDKKKCFFSMNTNCSSFVHDEWKKFISSLDRVMIMCSLDGVGDVGEWVRFGMKMKIWEKNTLRWKDLLKNNSTYTYGDMQSGVMCNFTLTNYTVFNIYETEEYLKSLDVPIRLTNCFFPEKLSPEYLPDKIKQKLPDHPFLQSILNKSEYSEQHCRDFVKYTEYLMKLNPAPKSALFVYNELKQYV